MPEPAPQPSFSPGRKWRIGFQVLFITLVIFSVVVMVNYLSRDYFFRLHVSSRTKLQLAPLTISLLKGITNRIQVTVYYDKEAPLYSTVVDLLSEYNYINPKISLLAVDYKRDVAAAEKIKAQYKLAAATDKNLVIFECEGHEPKIISGDALADYSVEQVPEDKETPYHRRLVAFKGEMAFTSCILAVINPKPFKAYFLTNHGEHQIDDNDDLVGYSKFASILQQNYVTNETLSLLGTNTVPLDCNLLVIAGPRNTIPAPELEKIDKYLSQGGGRLLVLFNFGSLNKDTGLEPILAKWGVAVGNNVVSDPEHSPSRTRLGEELVVSAFAKHPLVLPLLGQGLDLIQPRTISKLKSRTDAADAPQVQELAFSGQNSFLIGDPQRHQFLPLMVAVEKGAIKEVIIERGTTRIVVAGDSLFLANQLLDSYSNRDFAGYLANWLLDRPQLLGGLGPRPVKDFKLVATNAQMQSAQLILLGGMPGSVLLLGGLVWLRRRR